MLDHLVLVVLAVFGLASIVLTQLRELLRQFTDVTDDVRRLRAKSKRRGS